MRLCKESKVRICLEIKRLEENYLEVDDCVLCFPQSPTPLALTSRATVHRLSPVPWKYWVTRRMLHPRLLFFFVIPKPPVIFLFLCFGLSPERACPALISFPGVKKALTLQFESLRALPHAELRGRRALWRSLPRAPLHEHKGERPQGPKHEQEQQRTSACPLTLPCPLPPHPAPPRSRHPHSCAQPGGAAVLQSLRSGIQRQDKTTGTS